MNTFLLLAWLSVSFMFVDALGVAGQHWFPGGGVLLLALYIPHYLGARYFYRKSLRREISRMMSDYDDR
jgi:hypothetical protein